MIIILIHIKTAAAKAVGTKPRTGPNGQKLTRSNLSLKTIKTCISIIVIVIVVTCIVISIVIVILNNTNRSKDRQRHQRRNAAKKFCRARQSAALLSSLPLSSLSWSLLSSGLTLIMFIISQQKQMQMHQKRNPPSRTKQSARPKLSQERKRRPKLKIPIPEHQEPERHWSQRIATKQKRVFLDVFHYFRISGSPTAWLSLINVTINSVFLDEFPFSKAALLRQPSPWNLNPSSQLRNAPKAQRRGLQRSILTSRRW